MTHASELIFDWYGWWDKAFRPYFLSKGPWHDIPGLRLALLGTSGGGGENSHTFQYYVWAMSLPCVTGGESRYPHFMSNGGGNRGIGRLHAAYDSDLDKWDAYEDVCDAPQ